MEQLIAAEHPETDIDAALLAQQEEIDPHQLFRLLLLPLERVKQNPK